MPDQPPTTTGNARRTIIITVAVLLFVAALGLVRIFRTPRKQDDPPARAPDPRLEYTGPFRNVSPHVAYVPDSRCAECHAAIAASYAEHPMGRSLWPAAHAPAPPTGPEQNNPFVAFGSSFLVERAAGRFRHVRTRFGPDGQPPAEQDWEVLYVLGSGTRGYSYFAERDGYIFQTPVSWYSQKKKWDLSPGYGPALFTGRAVVPDCLFCHANRAHWVEGSVNHYETPLFDGHAIGCQRCHGPGELHVNGRDQAPGGFDRTIVNPKHLTPELRQAVCEQCHLQGAIRTLGRGRGFYDFRPGLPLESCWSVFLRVPERGEEPKAIGQVEQMYESRCFQGGAGPARLGCTSCHDPHQRVIPERRVAYYRARCIQCHEKKGCSLPLAERLRTADDDSCIACHMPRYSASDIPHTAATEHRILRHGKPAPVADQRPPPGDGFPVVSFYRGRKGVDPRDEERARALGLMKLTLMGDLSAARAAPYVLPGLQAALERDPHDLPAGEAYGYSLAVQDRSDEALAAFERVLASAPRRESALVGAASMALALGKTDLALDYWRRAVEANPWAPGYRQTLVLLLVKMETWPAAQAECEAWLRLDPMSTEARATRVSCLLATGNKDAARTEFARIEALAPANLRELQIRFAKKLK